VNVLENDLIHTIRVAVRVARHRVLGDADRRSETVARNRERRVRRAAWPLTRVGRLDLVTATVVVLPDIICDGLGGELRDPPSVDADHGSEAVRSDEPV